MLVEELSYSFLRNALNRQLMCILCILFITTMTMTTMMTTTTATTITISSLCGWKVDVLVGA